VTTKIYNDDDILDLFDDDIINVAYFFMESPQISLYPLGYENAPLSESFWTIEYPSSEMRSG
jgi:hypothetical protein